MHNSPFSGPLWKLFACNSFGRQIGCNRFHSDHRRPSLRAGAGMKMLSVLNTHRHRCIYMSRSVCLGVHHGKWHEDSRHSNEGVAEELAGKSRKMQPATVLAALHWRWAAPRVLLHLVHWVAHWSTEWRFISFIRLFVRRSVSFSQPGSVWSWASAGESHLATTPRRHESSRFELGLANELINN